MNLVKVRPVKKTGYPTFNQLFDEVFNQSFSTPANYCKQPAVNIIENADGYNIELAAPGLAKEDFDIKVEKDLLTISTEKKHEETTDEGNFTRREFNYASFSKSFHLPDTVDGNKIAATYENGVLTLSLPNKPEIKAKSKTIKIK